MVVLSMLNSEIDDEITNNLEIPTISYKSSDQCTGKVEILYDLFGLKIPHDNEITKRNDINFDHLNFQSIHNFIKKTHHFLMIILKNKMK